MARTILNPRFVRAPEQQSNKLLLLCLNAEELLRLPTDPNLIFIDKVFQPLRHKDQIRVSVKLEYMNANIFGALNFIQGPHTLHDSAPSSYPGTLTLAARGYSRGNEHSPTCSGSALFRENATLALAKFP
jgi:hypothetical protein